MKRMKKILIRLSVFALSFLVGMTIARIAKAQPSSVLWKIEGNGLEQPSYLMGTIHLICADELRFSQTLKDAMESSGQLYLELDFDDPEMMNELQSGLMLEEGMQLQDLMGEKELYSLDVYLKEHMEASVDAVSSIKPFFIMSMLYPQFLGCPTVSMEIELVGLAKGFGYEVFGLETVDEELAALDKIPLDVQAELLMRTITDPAELENLNRMRELYREENVNELYQFTRDGFDHFDGYSQVILDERNEKWITNMERAMRDTGTFFAVGAAHLGGENGLITLLKSKGYEIHPMVQKYEQLPELVQGEEEVLISRSWKIHESQLNETVEVVIETILENNPGAEEQILSQRGIIESMVKSTIKTYSADGSFVINIPNNPSQRGTWKFGKDDGVLLETDAEGKVTKKQVKELTLNRMILINEEGVEKMYAPAK